MFKRVEKRRKRRDEEEKLGLDEETREILGFNDTDSDESDTGSESEDNQAGDDLVSVRNGEPDSEGDIEEQEEEPPISIEEALKNPVYLISMDPTVHGCVLCRGKIIKNADMAVVHKGSVAHKRRYDRFKALASTVNSAANAWDIVKVLHSQRSEQECQSDQLSKRALKRQARQAALKEKRKRHKELKAKAMTKKAEKALKNDVTNADSATVPTKVSQPIQQGTSRRPGKRRKLEQDPPTLSKSQKTDKEKAPRVQESKRKRPKKSAGTKGTTIER